MMEVAEGASAPALEDTEAPMEVASPPVTDCNDYSRFDEIGDDSDDEVPGTAAAADSAAPELLSASSCMQRCTEFKELGNACFKSGDTAGSRVHYAEGTEMLTKHATVLLAANLKDDGDKLLAALHGNMAMAYLKEDNFAKTIEAASSVLGLEAGNVKALYRRGLSYSKTGFYPEGKADLGRCLEIEPSNAAARTALSDLAKSQRAHDAAEKRAFGKMFEGPSMYGDREKELADKQRRVLEREEMLQDEWSKSKLEKRRVADAGAEDQPFADFKVEFEKKEKEQREEAAKKKADEEMASSTAPYRESKPSSSRPKPKPESDDEEDEDLKDVRGYKTTSDGRKTTFFNNELDASTKQLIGDITPKAINGSGGGAAAAAAPGAVAGAAGGEGSPTSPTSLATSLDSGPTGIEASSWNKAGTWEERDMTSFVTERLKALCVEAACNTTADEPTALQLRGRIKSVKTAEGEAQIILARGKKRHVYDFNVTLEFEINVDSVTAPAAPSDEPLGDAPATTSSSSSPAAPGISKTIKGTLSLHDLSAASSTAGYEAEVKFSKALPAGLAGCIQSAAAALRDDVFSRLAAFEAEYKAL